MQRTTLFATSAVFLQMLVLAGACDRASDPAAPIEPAFARGPGGSTKLVNAKAVFEIQNGFAFAGDGLAADGSTTSDPFSTYDDGQCGVTTEIFWITGSQSGDAVMQGSRACGGRVAVIDLGSGMSARASFVNVRCVMQTVPGEQALPCPHPSEADAGDATVGYRNFAVDTDNSKCSQLRWDNDGDFIPTPQSNLPMKVTYEGVDGAGRRYWTAESLAPHRAGCINTVKGKSTWDGVVRVIPFSITVYEK